METWEAHAEALRRGADAVMARIVAAQCPCHGRCNNPHYYGLEFPSPHEVVYTRIVGDRAAPQAGPLRDTSLHFTGGDASGT